VDVDVDVDVDDGLQASGYGLRARDRMIATVKAARFGGVFAHPSALRGRCRWRRRRRSRARAGRSESLPPISRQLLSSSVPRAPIVRDHFDGNGYVNGNGPRTSLLPGDRSPSRRGTRASQNASCQGGRRRGRTTVSQNRRRRRSGPRRANWDCRGAEGQRSRGESSHTEAGLLPAEIQWKG